MADDGWTDDPVWAAPPQRPSSTPNGRRPGNNGPPSSRSRGFGSGFGGDGAGKSSLTFSIGGRDVGKLIGRAGSSINDIRDKSGCRIDVGGESADDRRGIDIIVSGADDETCRKCQEMIEDHLGYNTGFYGPPSSEPEVIDWAAINSRHQEAQKERWSKCPTLIKEFYTEHRDVAAMTDEEVADFRRRNHDIAVQNFDPESKAAIMKPVVKFEHAFGGFPDVMSTIRRQGFEKPSPIQAQAWPYLMSGKDMIGIAQTGTGKTLAFLMPAFIHVDEQPFPREERGGPNVLVLCPTRELALQIEGEVKKYEYRGIKSVCVYGGGDRRKQMKIVTDGVQIVIATPGRLNDLIESKCIQVESITYLVLDEADRMLDMGFEPQIRKVMLDIRPDRQTVMTSATWPQGVRRLATSYMNDPVTINVGSFDLAAVHSVTQQILMVEDEAEKREILTDFISKMEPDDKVMIFVGKKTRADDISSDLSLEGVDCQCIHGDREQSDREQAIADLKSGEVRILIATDVASRGIDINDITYVVNFDFPRNIEEYVHRVGRTGRAGKTGTSITMMEKKDRKQAQELIDILKEANQEVPDELVDMAERYARWKTRSDEEKKMYGGVGGGGRGGDGCFKCGEPGHFSRECPTGGGGGGRGGGGRGGGGGGGNCYNCNQPGHLSRNCPRKSGGPTAW